MPLATLDDLLVDQLGDLLDAEHRIVKALPKLARAATNPALRSAFEDHLTQTKTHVERLERAFSLLKKPAKKRPCAGIRGLLEEGDEFLKKGKGIDPAVRDAGLIASAQRVEHYEMAGYGCARSFARTLGQSEVENLLQMTLDEEGDADRKLSDIAETSVNPSAT